MPTTEELIAAIKEVHRTRGLHAVARTEAIQANRRVELTCTDQLRADSDLQRIIDTFT